MRGHMLIHFRQHRDDHIGVATGGVFSGLAEQRVRVRLTEKGRKIRLMLNELFARHAETLEKRG
ncbi:hypothetical protein, partial [Roseateles sp.]|uniref:hypothetical protein n=1 Tax=Roseateles sp. TaxID=1971397 RepID=UPI00286B6265